MTLLQIVNAAQAMVNLPVTSTIYSNTADAERQLLALLNMEGRLLSTAHPWQRLIVEKSFLTTATNQQTDADAAIPSDLDRIIDETLWNRTLRQPVTGPISPIQWQSQKGLGITAVYSSYRMYENSFYFTPAPAAGQSIYYEYVSKNWCQSSGGTGQSQWAADTDVGILPDNIMILGLVWRWLEAKGFDFSSRKDEYDRERAKAIAHDGTRRKSRIEGPVRLDIYGPYVAEGSWAITV